MIKVSIHVGEKWGSAHYLAGHIIGAQTLRTAYRQFGDSITRIAKNKQGEAIGGLTVTKGLGYWLSVPENCSIFTLYLSEAEYAYASAALAKAIQTLKTVLAQDAIMVTSETVHLEFV